jgi:glycosyltransferase involved in cell wall biosynthesis
MKKIYIVCFLKLEDLPPAVTLLKTLSEDYEIEYVGLNDKTKYYDDLFNHKVTFHNVIPYDEPKEKGLHGKVRRYVYWRMVDWWEKHAINIINNRKKSEYVWILHEYTVKKLGKAILNQSFILTMYELDDDLFSPKDNALKKFVRTAEKVVVPEYARAAIVQACVGLKNLPYVVPNKPYEFNQEQIQLPENKYAEVAEEIHKDGKKIIIYSGIFLRERRLETIIQTIETLRDKYELVLIGQKSDYLEELLCKYPFVRYWGFVKAPQHMSYIRLADIGVLTYVADKGSINSVFCAPNKTWEYSKYGLPMLCNDIPGLKYSVEYNSMGYCCDINSVEDIASKLELLDKNYETLRKNTLTYYKSVNIGDVIKNVIEENKR